VAEDETATAADAAVAAGEETGTNSSSWSMGNSSMFNYLWSIFIRGDRMRIEN